MGDDSPEAKAKVMAAQAKMRDFIKEAGRTRRYDREQIVSTNNVAEKKSVANGSGSGIILNTDTLRQYAGKHIPVTQDVIDRFPLIFPTCISVGAAEKVQFAHKELLNSVKSEPIGTELAFALNMNGEIIGRYHRQKVKIMWFALSTEMRQRFESFLEEHPIPNDYDPEIIDDTRSIESENVATAVIMRQLLKKDKNN